MKFLNALIALFCLLSSGFVSGQEIAEAFDHELLIDQLNTSEVAMYWQIVKSYDSYLDKHSDDVYMEIEKCKFIGNAQYDSYDDYNPNQMQFDSCAEGLLEKFPKHPAVLCYHTEFSWGEDLDEIISVAEQAMRTDQEAWTDIDRGVIFHEKGMSFYYDDEYAAAKIAMTRALEYNPEYLTDINYIHVMNDAGETNRAKLALAAKKDSTENNWVLSQKAALCIELEDFENALAYYELIEAKDSTYNDDAELGEVMEGLGQYQVARDYFVSDTSRGWMKEQSKFRLFQHDLDFQHGDSCISSYNAYRDIGFSADPLSVHRLKLFLKDPFQGWKFRDFGGLLLFLLILVGLVLFPTIWILPVYFIGHKWGIALKNISMKSPWGLKAFWWVSIGYMMATFFSMFVDINIVYSWINWEEYATDSEESEASYMIAFMSIMAFFAFTVLIRSGVRLYFSKTMVLRHIVGLVIAYFVMFKVVSVIYIRIGVNLFDADLDALLNFGNLLMASREDIMALTTAYGSGVTLLVIGIVVPIYEEIVFRGVILKSCERYLNFKWANLLQAALFALIHDSLFLFPIFFAFGIFTGLLVKKTGSLFGGILFHIINNLIAGVAIIAASNAQQMMNL